MDSMRTLNTSLPRTSPRRRARGLQPPEALLSAFKAAALSVTTLYKTAASDQAKARAEGYQDALDDLLVFLDRENLGLGDGEGWRVRRWATERLDGSSTGRAESDDEEEDVAEEDKARSSSPEVTRKQVSPEEEAPEQSSLQEELAQPEQPPVQLQQHQQTPTFAIPQTMPFNFRSTHPYPSNHDREADNMSVTSDAPSHGTDNSHTPVRVELVPRSSRPKHSRSSNNRQSNNNSRSLGSGAGSKRKVPLGDFFDISGFSFDSKDDFSSGRGGKRGRHV